VHRRTAPGPQLFRVYAYLASPRFPQARRDAVEGASACCFTDVTIGAKRNYGQAQDAGNARSAVTGCRFNGSGGRPLSVHFSPWLSGTVRHSSPILISNTSGDGASGAVWLVGAAAAVRAESRLQAPELRSDRVLFKPPPNARAGSAPGTGMRSRPRSRRSGSGTGSLARSGSARCLLPGASRCSGPFRVDGFRVPRRIAAAGGPFRSSFRSVGVPAGIAQSAVPDLWTTARRTAGCPQERGGWLRPGSG
jgi:hypothetical protein